jgi:Periplasmic binding protein
MVQRSSRTITLAMTAAALLAAITLAPPSGAQGNAAATASDVGVTPREIRIAVIADVENAFQPGLFRGAVDGMRAFAKYVNSKGGLAGRKVRIDFIDSRLSADDARNAIIKACAEDFAMVGTTALFVNNLDDAASCPDKAGRTVGLPDIPALSVEVTHQCSKLSFAINPAQLDCATRAQTPQTWRANRGSLKYYRRTLGGDRHGVFVFSSDLKSTRIGGLGVSRGFQAGGVQSDGEEGVSALAPQSALTPVIQIMKDQDSNYSLTAAAVQTVVGMRKEAKLQGLDSKDIVWECSACYSDVVLKSGGPDVEGEYTQIQHLPFTEGAQNKSMANFIKFIGKTNIDDFGAYAWAAGLLFRDAVNAVVKKSGDNGLTRQALLDELSKIHNFDADGMWGKTDIANHDLTPCFVLMQIKHGEFVRVYPKKPGTFDCTKSNVIEYQSDILGE